MEREKSITSFRNIDKEKYSTVGVVIVLAHKKDNDVQVLLFNHKASDKTADGTLGLPSETMRWNRKDKKTESIKDTIARCFYEEIGYSIQKHQFFANPNKVYKELPFIIPTNIKPALARVVTMWTENIDFIPEEINTPEIKGAEFLNLNDILNKNSEVNLRLNTYEILKYLNNNNFFKFNRTRRPINSFENRGLVPINLTPDVKI